MCDNFAMAESDPLMKDKDDRQEEEEEEEEEEENQNPFKPVGSSTPVPRGEEISMKTMHHEKSGLPDKSYIEETSFGGTGRTSGRSVTTKEIEDRLKKLRDFNTGLIGTKNAGENEQLLSDADRNPKGKRLHQKRISRSRFW